MRCSLWALVVLGTLIAVAGPLRADRRDAAPALPPFDDSKWVRYVGPEYVMYCAFRGPKQQPGPIVQSWLKSSEAALARSDSPDNPVGQAVKAKVLERALDLFEGGGAAALAGNAKNGKILVVLSRTPALERFLEWLKKTYTKAPYQAKAATIGGAPALLWEEKGKVELAVALTDTEVVLADKQADLEAALELARGAKKSFAATFGYERLRRRCRPSATAIFSMVPGEHILAMMQEQENIPPALERAARVGLQTMNGNLIELHGTASAARFDYYLSVDPRSEGYQSLKLDKRHKFYSTRTVKAAEAIPGDVVAFFTGLQPTYDTREVAASGNFVGFEESKSNQQQWDVLKGQLQVQTGLSFDAEVVPWLGPESGVFVRAAGDGYEIGGLVDVTDPPAAQASLEKAIRHIKISRGVPFAEATVSGVKLHKAAPAEKNPAFAPAACVTDKHLILGTAPAVVEATVQFPVKAAASDHYLALTEALGKRRIVMAIWTQTAPIAKLIHKVEEARGKKPATKPSELTAMLDGLDALAAGVAVPESDLVHMHLQVWGK